MTPTGISKETEKVKHNMISKNREMIRGRDKTRIATLRLRQLRHHGRNT